MPLQKSALPIVDEEISLFVNKAHKDASLTKILTSETLNNEFLDNYFNWLKSSELVQYKGIDEFDQKSYIHGSVQGFDFFYAEFSQRRFRCFKGDFVYHALSWRNNYSYIFLDDEDLDKNDAVVISLPFSDSGSIHPRTIEILKKCEELNIPVLIDCAYINLSGELSVDLSYKCIHSVCFSLSKAFFSINRLRVGLRLKRKFNDDPVDVFNSLSMINNYGAFMGNELIKNFSPDFNYLKYSKKQKEVCVKNDLTPSKCVIFGLGGEKYQDYNRGGAFNRVCLSEVLV